ncbi:8-oxoguanine DNA glycosylase, putative [Leishmania guyanensis]
MMPPKLISGRGEPPPWRVLTSSLKAKVNLQLTLCGGQCFHWYPTPRCTFVGVLNHSVFELREVRCAAKLKKQDELRHVASQRRAPTLGQRRQESRSAPRASESDINVSKHFSCCWIEYRRLWPLADPQCFSEKVPMSTPSSSLWSTGAPPSLAIEESDEEMLSRYLSLDVDLDQLWQNWTASPQTRKHPLVQYLVGNRLQLHSLLSDRNQRVCEHDKAQKSLYISIRHVRQDLHSCLFSFLCSQNNNVTRITGMIYALCRAYGDQLCDVQLATAEVRTPCKLASDREHKLTKTELRRQTAAHKEDVIASPSLKPHRSSINAPGWLSMYSFPSLEQLSAATEEKLRMLGFGYRGKYIVDTIRFIQTQSPQQELQDNVMLKGQMHPPPHLMRQHGACYRNGFYSTVLGHHDHHHQHQRDMLLLLPGVGRKVADCVALFALNRTHIVPVDTHMAQVAAEYLVSPRAAVPAGRKRSRPGCLLLEGERYPCDDVLLEWRKQVEALKEKNGVSSTSVQTIKSGGRSASAPPRSSRKTPVPPLYERHHNVIQDAFLKLFGNYAGWAHSILFYYRMHK